jgi:hypothetical protein
MLTPGVMKWRTDLADFKHWVKEGVGLVVHFPSEDVAKINTP